MISVGWECEGLATYLIIGFGTIENVSGVQMINGEAFALCVVCPRRSGLVRVCLGRIAGAQKKTRHAYILWVSSHRMTLCERPQKFVELLNQGSSPLL